MKSVEEKLKEFKVIQDFVAVGVFNPQGESLSMITGDKSKLREVGAQINNVLRNIQKATHDLGFGGTRMLHVEAENAHVLIRCYNESSQPMVTEPGKAHIHLVLVLGSDSGIGLAKMMSTVYIKSIAEDFRM